MDEALGIEPARFEFSATCFPAIEDLFAKTGVSPSQVKFVVTNSSLFNPTPSLSAMVMNHFKMPLSTKNYSLGGMGCSGMGTAAVLAGAHLLANISLAALYSMA
jgi:3-ketoacyl-CoA synthase